MKYLSGNIQGLLLACFNSPLHRFYPQEDTWRVEQQHIEIPTMSMRTLTELKIMKAPKYQCKKFCSKPMSRCLKNLATELHVLAYGHLQTTNSAKHNILFLRHHLKEHWISDFKF